MLTLSWNLKGNTADVKRLLGTILHNVVHLRLLHSLDSLIRRRISDCLHAFWRWTSLQTTAIDNSLYHLLELQALT